MIVWRNKSDLDTMSLDDLYNHLKDINKIDEDDMEEIDIKWNIALLSMMADRFWKKTWKKISIQGTDVAGFDKSKTPKALMAIDEVGWDWSYIANDDKNHALVADEEAPSEFALMAKTSVESENILYHYKFGLAQVEARLAEHRNQELKYCKKIRVLEFKTESRANCIESLTKDLELLKKEKGFPEFADDNVTDYSKHAPTVQSSPDDAQSRNPSVTATEASPSTITPKPFIKFVKATDRSTEIKTAKHETDKPAVKYATIYSKPSKSSNVRGNQRNWNNLKSHQLGVKKGRTCPSNSHKTTSPKTVIHKPYRPPIRPMRPNMNVAQPNRTFFYKTAHSYTKRPFQRTSAVRSQYRGPRVPPVSRKFSTVNRKFPTANRKFPNGGTKFSTANMGKKGKAGSSQNNIDDKGYWDSGFSRHMTGNISYLSDYELFDEGYVSFGQGGCKITGKGTIKTRIKREFSNARTPQQNGVAERRNRTLIEAARTMLADAKLHVTFWAKAVNTACYVQNRVLDNKSHNKTPYELFIGRTPTIGFLKPFGCHVMILNTLDNLGKFDAKGDEGYFIGYSMSSKSFRVFNKITKRVEENLHVDFLENKAIEKGGGPNWLFDIDSFTKSMNYVPVVVAGTKDASSQEVKKYVSSLRYIALPNWVHDALLKSFSSKPQDDCSTDVPKSSGNSNPTATSTNPSANQMRKLTVKLPFPLLVHQFQLLALLTLKNPQAHDALLEFSLSQPQDHCSTKVPEGNGNSNPAASTSNPPADQMETPTVETLIPIVVHIMCGFVKGNLIIYTSFEPLSIGVFLESHHPTVDNMCINFLHGSDSEQRTHEFIHVYLASASVYVWTGSVIFSPVASLFFC
nr:ribonuclease H-like domain-containing protein [Tanacetum cinerariifolium]